MHRHGQRPRTTAHEFNDLGHQRVLAHRLRDVLEPFAERAGAEEHGLVGAADGVDVGLRAAAPAQPDDVDPDQIGERALRHAPWNDIGAHAGEADDHRALADAHELAYRRLAAEHRAIADADMAAEHDVVGEGHAVADFAVMPHMRSDHEETAIADFGDGAILLGADIHGDVFADVAICPDHQAGWTALVFG